MPYWVRAVVSYGGKPSEFRSLDFGTREEAEAELAKIKDAQATFKTGSIHNVAPYTEAQEKLPTWLSTDVGLIVGASVEGSG